MRSLTGFGQMIFSAMCEWSDAKRTGHRAALLPSSIRNSLPLKAAEHSIDQGIDIRIGEVNGIAVVWK